VPVDFSLIYNLIWTAELVLHRNGYIYVDLYILSFRGCLSSKIDSINSFRIDILEYFEHQVSRTQKKRCMASSVNTNNLFYYWWLYYFVN